MELVSVWLIHNKASLSQYSPMNFDGSAFMVGIGVVPAPNMKKALELFDQYLNTQEMKVLEVWKCEQYSPENFAEPTQDNRDIKEVAIQALEDGGIFYVCGTSSEALDDEEGDDNE